MIQILIVEDEPQLRKAIAKSISNAGYFPVEAENGQVALTLFYETKIDLIITDIMMPVMDGYEFVKEIRKIDKDVPIIMLTALGELDNKLSGFTSGTDDYLVKPISLKELSARVQAMIRRAKINADQKIVLPHTVLDYKAQSLTVMGENIKLNNKQFLLLYTLLLRPGVIFSREELLDEVWGLDNYSLDRTVDTHISWLRNKVKSPDFEIVSMWGVGYKVELNEKEKI